MQQSEQGQRSLGTTKAVAPSDWQGSFVTGMDAARPLETRKICMRQSRPEQTATCGPNSITSVASVLQDGYVTVKLSHVLPSS